MGVGGAGQEAGGGQGDGGVAIRCDEDDDDDDDEALCFLKKSADLSVSSTVQMCVVNGTVASHLTAAALTATVCLTTATVCLTTAERWRHLCLERGAIMQAAMQTASLRPLLTLQSARNGFWLRRSNGCRCV